MKKFLALTFAAAVLGLSACSPSSAETGGGSNTPPAKIVENSPTIEPPQEPTEKAAVEAYEVTYSGVELYTSSLGKVWSQVIIEITNTGDVPLYLGSASYDLEDDDGALAATSTLPSTIPNVILAGEKGYIYEETTLDGISADAKLTVIPHVKPKAAKVEQIHYPVSDISIKDDTVWSMSFMGRVENNTEEPLKLTSVAIILYDADEKPIGIMDTLITDDIAVGEKMGFEGKALKFPPSVNADAVKSYKTIAYPSMQFQF
ncbi:hypothetical protein AGMMS49975_05230 [Clostridia bacterium]|nr:hypothetical protein AGMMS49975_05230 [Clostridia bacterium]